MPDRRTFTYEQALALLPRVVELTSDAAARIEEITGDSAIPDESEDLAIPEDILPEVERILSSWASSIIDLGAEVKGLWLVDFDSGSGYYCWRFPEPTLEFFHGYEEGFRGRIALQ